MNRCHDVRLAVVMWNIFLLSVPIYLSLTTANAAKQDNGNLVAVALIFRHGDRSPISSFPLDEYYNLQHWPMGFGHLTKYGISRLYNLGKWLRLRYNNFLSKNYSPNEIYVRSSNVDRCLMSANAALAGLYPPTGYQLWNPELHWQPIPVHTDDKNHDEIITEKRECKKFDEILPYLQQATYPAFERNYTGLIKYLSNRTGWTVSLREIKTLYSVFKSYNSFNRSFIPEWSENINMEVLETLASVVYGLPSSIPDMARLRIGPFYNYLFDYFETFINDSVPNKPKFLMISAHDTTLSSVLGAMKAFEKPVKFGDAVIWELKQRFDGSYYINVLYKSTDELNGMRIMDCSVDCDYYSYKTMLSNITINFNDWERECNDINK